jgi:thioredoxin 1
MSPIIDQLEQERPDITIMRVNVDENPETSKDFGVSGIPTYVLMHGGTEISRASGALPKQQFLTTMGLDN